MDTINTRRTTRWLPVLLGAIPLLGLGAGRLAGDASAADPDAETVPFPGLGLRARVEVASTPRPVRSEGQVHLVHELILTSFDPRDVRLDRLDVHAGHGSGRVLASFEARALESMMRGGSEARGLPSGTVRVVFIWVAVPESEPLPARIGHTLTFWGATGQGSGPLVVEAPDVELGPPTRRVLSPPLRGERWYAHAGPANVSHHRNTLAPRDGVLTMDQRFATDWIRLETVTSASDGTRYAPDWASTFGSPIHAVDDGVVVNVVDGLPNDRAFAHGFGDAGNDEYAAWRSRPAAITWDTIGGNLVTVRMQDGSYAWYEHIQPGTIRVREGDTVARGQMLGLVGSSGNAGAPHLHFEVTDSPVKGHGEGLPYVFESYVLHQRFEPMPGWNPLVRSSPAELGMTATRGKTDRNREIPRGGSVVTFAE